MLIVALGSVALLFACAGNAADDGPPLFPLPPAWHYVAEQRSPTMEHVEGDVQLSHQGGTRFDGSIDVLLTDAFGRVDRRTGLLAGRSIDAANVDFDARLDNADVRRHIGHVSGDTIAGEWAQSTGSALASGTFRMVRR